MFAHGGKSKARILLVILVSLLRKFHGSSHCNSTFYSIYGSF